MITALGSGEDAAWLGEESVGRTSELSRLRTAASNWKCSDDRGLSGAVGTRDAALAREHRHLGRVSARGQRRTADTSSTEEQGGMSSSRLPVLVRAQQLVRAGFDDGHPELGELRLCGSAHGCEEICPDL